MAVGEAFLFKFKFINLMENKSDILSNSPAKAGAKIRARIVCPRKIDPQFILFQLEPVLRKLNLRYGVSTLSLFADFFESKGITIRECPLEIDNPLNCELTFFDLLSEGEEDIGASPPKSQTMLPSTIIRLQDGSEVQGFSLRAPFDHRTLPAETFYIPDHNSFHIGALVECTYDRTEEVWKANGKGKRVQAAWNEQSLQDSPPYAAQTSEAN